MNNDGLQGLTNSCLKEKYRLGHLVPWIKTCSYFPQTSHENRRPHCLEFRGVWTWIIAAVYSAHSRTLVRVQACDRTVPAPKEQRPFLSCSNGVTNSPTCSCLLREAPAISASSSSQMAQATRSTTRTPVVENRGTQLCHCSESQEKKRLHQKQS